MIQLGSKLTMEVNLVLKDILLNSRDLLGSKTMLLLKVFDKLSRHKYKPLSYFHILILYNKYMKANLTFHLQCIITYYSSTCNCYGTGRDFSRSCHHSRVIWVIGYILYYFRAFPSMSMSF